MTDKRSVVTTLRHNLRRKMRMRLTGDENKSVRDEARMKLKNPNVIRVIDMASFCNGVFGIVLTQYMMLRHAEWFWAYYAVVIISLLIIRYFMYSKNKMQYFLIDFCYFVQATHLYEAAFPSPTLFTINFLFANGPLAFAIIAWRNSLVFHSLDKVTSVYIHVLPLCLSYCDRWARGKGLATPDAVTFLMATGLYLVWQTLYLLVTEVKDKKKFDTDKDLTSSLRWLAQKGHNIPSAVFARRVLVATGLMGKDEPFRAESLKTKMIMVLSQLIFTVACMLWAFIIYHSEALHIISSLLILGCSVWNGAQYYFEVFAGNYQYRITRAPREADDSQSASQPSTPEEDGLSRSSSSTTEE
eukprot:TRINITY_DN9454_c4_g1_i1.p1 TRINITY_DN9454_c4_g1~~TRINITY_DN9454_c4_g1_i1.p1  ORF type:complete len:372 (+),score=147.85 TRINITY_DN9454_c4_g1_i1:47-1117(+)